VWPSGRVPTEPGARVDVVIKSLPEVRVAYSSCWGVWLLRNHLALAALRRMVCVAWTDAAASQNVRDLARQSGGHTAG
jgi:hypothetical protein